LPNAGTVLLKIGKPLLPILLSCFQSASVSDPQRLTQNPKHSPQILSIASFRVLNAHNFSPVTPLQPRLKLHALSKFVKVSGCKLQFLRDGLKSRKVGLAADETDRNSMFYSTLSVSSDIKIRDHFPFQTSSKIRTPSFEFRTAISEFRTATIALKVTTFEFKTTTIAIQTPFFQFKTATIAI
jgi:hypothetical protein